MNSGGLFLLSVCTVVVAVVAVVVLSTVFGNAAAAAAAVADDVSRLLSIGKESMSENIFWSLLNSKTLLLDVVSSLW